MTCCHAAEELLDWLSSEKQQMNAAAGQFCIITLSCDFVLAKYLSGPFELGMLCFDPHFQFFNLPKNQVESASYLLKNFQAMSMQIRSHSPVFSTYDDLGYVQVLCLVTQHWHIKRRQTRQIRREGRLSDSCLPGWVTLLRDPLRGALPWVTSVAQSGRTDFKHEACTTSTPSCSSLSCCSPELHGGSLKTIPAVTTP